MASSSMTQLVIVMPSGRHKAVVIDSNMLHSGEELNQLVRTEIGTGYFVRKERTTNLEASQCAAMMIRVLPKLMGGATKMSAAEKAKLEQAKALREDISSQNYQMWFDCADNTRNPRCNPGVMKLLCVSNVLLEDKESIHGSAERDGNHITFPSSPLCTEPHSESYGREDHNTGELVKDFHRVFSRLHYCSESSHDGILPLVWWYLPEHSSKSKHSQHPSERRAVKLVLSDSEDGLWYKGPRQILPYDMESKTADQEKPEWDLARLLEKPQYKDLWCAERKCFKPPWKVDGPFRDIERWIFDGIGTVTYIRAQKISTDQGKNEQVEDMYLLWSQEDTSGPMNLTDRERLRLKQRFQLLVKSRKAALTPDETALCDDLDRNYVVPGPCHHEDEKAPVEVLQWRIRPLRQQLFDKCVFWANVETDLPGGSVAEQLRCPSLQGPPSSKWGKANAHSATPGKGLESVEFFKYEAKVGALRKRYIVEDRQRLLDMIETLTPDYQGLVKYAGQPPDDDGKGDHLMTPDMEQTIVNAAALALDMNLPDLPEDKIACYIKRMVEQTLGPTWHVVVGRSFGFYIQCEARHMIHLYMQHLAILVWKSEPAGQ